MKRVQTLLITILICVGVIWLAGKLKLIPDLGELFSSKPVEIDKTSILVKDIRSIGQVVTATLIDEVVVDSVADAPGSNLINKINKSSPFPFIREPKKQLVIIAKGKVLSGVDLQLLSENSVKISGDTVWLQLPAATILDVIINPAGYETFQETGDWSHEAVTAVKLKATERIRDRALQQNIIIKADQKAKMVMEDFLSAAGFITVIVGSPILQ